MLIYLGVVVALGTNNAGIGKPDTHDLSVFVGHFEFRAIGMGRTIKDLLGKDQGAESNERALG